MDLTDAVLALPGASRRATDHHHVAEVADFLVVQNVAATVLAHSGLPSTNSGRSSKAGGFVSVVNSFHSVSSPRCE